MFDFIVNPELNYQKIRYIDTLYCIINTSGKII